ncbi:hypothetical protein TNCV_1129011 [Trichonephila clavipes]|nr:hypothetical protein TNCV_1129011 [Trichonephila clavipes]
MAFKTFRTVGFLQTGADELIEMHEQEQDFEDYESLDFIQSENRMTVDNLTEVIEQGLQILENTYSNEECIFSTKQGIQKGLACHKEILGETINL